MFRLGRATLLGALLAGVLTGCGGPPEIDQYQTGRSSRYLPGVPTFDVETVPSIPGQQAGIDLYLSVPSSSMTFERTGEGFRAMQEVQVALRAADEDENEAFVLERSWIDTIAVPTYAATQRHDPFLLRRHLVVPAGQYRVEVTLENLSSEKSDVRRQQVSVPDSATRTPFMGKILIRALTAQGRFLPVVPFHVPSGLDSLECMAAFENLDPARPSIATAALLHYDTDTLAAEPPWVMTSFDLPLGYGMVHFESPDTVRTVRQTIVAGNGEERLALSLRGLPLGNYKAVFSLQTPTDGSGSGDTLLQAERFIPIGGPTFPRPSTLPELIEAMGYIARREEMKLLREAPTPEVARARFDSLWLSFRHDRQAAADLLNRYYSRVEEANRRFTSTKEGWRTDQGMLYVVLGPPVDVMTTKDRQVWYYDLRGNDAVNVYSFQRRFATNGHVTLETYYLYRQAYYETFWERMVDKWRSGEVF